MINTMSTKFACALPVEMIVKAANDGCIFNAIAKLSDEEIILVSALIEMGYTNQITLG